MVPPAAPSAEDSLLITEQDEARAIEPQDLYREALKIVREAGEASATTLQQGLGICYADAVQLIDLMEREGIVAAPDGSKPRRLLVPLEPVCTSPKGLFPE